MSSANTLFSVLLATGFTVGFGHCIGMCGPIIVSLSLSLKGERVIVPHLLYNGGRITTYAILGGLMGLTGSFATLGSNVVGLQKGVMIFSGILIIIMGLSMTGWLPMWQIFRNRYNPEGFISKGFQKVAPPKSSLAYYPLGLLLGLLPCGPVYTALIAAARSGMETTSSLQGILLGAGLMLAFGIGTVPALFIVARLSDLGWLKSREIVYKIGSLLMVIVGVYFVIKGIRF